MATKVAPDPMFIDGEIRRGTSLWRVIDVLDNKSADEEFGEFYAGDLRDVCGICEGEAAKSIREKIKGKPVGEVMNIPLAEVRQLVSAAKRPSRAK